MRFWAWQFEGGFHRQAGLWLAVAGACLAWTIPAAAEARSLRVAVVLSSAARPYTATWTRAQTELTEAGHKPSMFLLEALQKAGAKLPEVDAYLAVGSPAAVWLDARLPAKTPMVFCMVAWPGQTSLTDETPRAGVAATVAIARQLELIGQALPGEQKIGMLTRSDSQLSRWMVKSVALSLPRRWEMVAVAIDKHKTPADAINALMNEKPTVVLATVDANIYSVPVIRTLLLEALRHRVAVMGFSAGFVQAGALLGTDIDPEAQAAQAVGLLVRLYGTDKPAKAGDIAAEAPKFDIAVNQIVAERIQRPLSRKLVESARYVYAREDK